MAREPDLGQAPHPAELAKIGIRVSDSTVRKYKPKRRRPPSQTWRTFLEDHLDCTVGMDFFVVVTATFRILYVLVIVSHERRRVLYFNVTSNPSAQWTAQQVVQAFPFDAARARSEDSDHLGKKATRHETQTYDVSRC